MSSHYDSHDFQDTEIEILITDDTEIEILIMELATEIERLIRELAAMATQ